MDISHSTQYKIKNYLIKNINLNYDIYIYKPEFLTKNISNFKFSLIDTNGIVTNELEGYLFDIIIGFSSIYSNNFITNKDVFEYSDIPFEYIIYHEPIFIIYNIPIKIIKNILEYHLEITWIESQTLQKYPSNTLQPNAFDKIWSVGLKEKYNDCNSLRIMGGMIGCSYNSIEYDKKYIDSHANIIYADEHNSALCIQYIDKDKNWIDGLKNELEIYDLSKIINVLITTKKKSKSKFF